MPLKVNPRSNYAWNEKANRYVDQKTGRFVPRQAVLAEHETAIKASSARVDAISRQLVDGNITLAQWQLAMEREIKNSHTAAAALSKGGWAQMNQSDWGYVGSQIKEQYRYLANFANDIASGKQKLDGRLINRASLYSEHARAMREEFNRRMMKRKGLQQERRVLGPTEHCEDSGDKLGCVTIAAKGWQPIGTLPKIGEATCVTHCVIGETLVQSPEIEVAYRRLYTGDAIELVTARGRTLTITPNHPLLTSRGWVPAQLLRKDDSLICGTLAEKMAFRNPYIYDVPTAISEIFATLNNSSRDAARIMGSDVQFHGDGSNTDVDIVFANRLLVNRIVSAISKPFHKKSFPPSDIMAAPGFSMVLKLFVRGFLAPSGGMSLANVGESLFRGHSCHPQFAGEFSAPGIDSGHNNTRPDYVSTDGVTKTDRLLGFTRNITLDNIVNLRRCELVNIHVYNLQTSTNWYIANGIITHNCKCVFEYR